MRTFHVVAVVAKQGLVVVLHQSQIVSKQQLVQALAQPLELVVQVLEVVALIKTVVFPALAPALIHVILVIGGMGQIAQIIG